MYVYDRGLRTIGKSAGIWYEIAILVLGKHFIGVRCYPAPRELRQQNDQEEGRLASHAILLDAETPSTENQKHLLLRILSKLFYQGASTKLKDW